MAQKTYNFVVRDANTIRDAMLRVWRNEMINQGVANPDATPGSDIYIFFEAIAEQIAVGDANNAVRADDTMPDTATGTDLDRWLAIFGLSRKSAGGSIGNITLTSSASTTIASGTQLLDASGLRYQVSQTGTYANGATVPVTSVDTGIATNLAAGTTLQWVSPPAYAASTAVVAAGGLTNGVDAEDDETARARLQTLLANAPSSGNVTDVIMLGQASDPSVQMTWVYPAAQGPATVHFAVATAPTATTGDPNPTVNRDISATTVNNVIVPYVSGQLPVSIYVVGTTVTNVPTDVAFYMTLPSSATASPPGPGGGWLDGTPWPTYAANGYADVTAVTSSTVFTVHADVAPTAGVSRIAWLSPLTWQLYTAKVLSFTGSGPTYTITVDTPLTNIAVGHLVFPQSVNQQTYVTAVLNQFALMGPGEKTSNVSILTRGYRHPTPQLAWPYSLNAVMLRALSDAGDEVLDTSFAYRSTTTPAVPAAITDPPNILVPRNLAFYPTPS